MSAKSQARRSKASFRAAEVNRERHRATVGPLLSVSHLDPVTIVWGEAAIQPLPFPEDRLPLLPHPHLSSCAGVIALTEFR